MITYNFSGTAEISVNQCISSRSLSATAGCYHICQGSVELIGRGKLPEGDIHTVAPLGTSPVRQLFLCVERYDVEDDLAGLLDAFERDILHLAVEVMAAGEDVGTRESHK